MSKYDDGIVLDGKETMGLVLVLASLFVGFYYLNKGMSIPSKDRGPSGTIGVRG